MSADRADQPAMPLDTSVAAQAIQREVYLRLGGKARLAITFRLNHTVRALAMAGIRSRHPEYAEGQVTWAYRRLVLGDDLVRAVWPDHQLVDP